MVINELYKIIFYRLFVLFQTANAVLLVVFFQLVYGRGNSMMYIKVSFEYVNVSAILFFLFILPSFILWSLADYVLSEDKIIDKYRIGSLLIISFLLFILLYCLVKNYLRLEEGLLCDFGGIIKISSLVPYEKKIELYFYHVEKTIEINNFPEEIKEYLASCELVQKPDKNIIENIPLSRMNPLAFENIVNAKAQFVAMSHSIEVKLLEATNLANLQVHNKLKAIIIFDTVFFQFPVCVILYFISLNFLAFSDK